MTATQPTERPTDAQDPCQLLADEIHRQLRQRLDQRFIINRLASSTVGISNIGTADVLIVLHVLVDPDALTVQCVFAPPVAAAGRQRVTESTDTCAPDALERTLTLVIALLRSVDA